MVINYNYLQLLYFYNFPPLRNAVTHYRLTWVRVPIALLLCITNIFSPSPFHCTGDPVVGAEDEALQKWVLLKRAEGKSGQQFTPLRKILVK